MELKDRKLIKNLPGFINGFDMTRYNTDRNGVGLSPVNVLDLNKLREYAPLAAPTTNAEKPTFVAKSTPAENINNWIALAQFGGQGILQAYNDVSKRPDEYVEEAGKSEGNVGGVSYQEINPMSYDKMVSNYDEQTGASFLSNPITAIGRLFGRSHAKEQMRKAIETRKAINETNMANANSIRLQQEYYSNNGNAGSQLLYVENGKDAIQTSSGELQIQPNSKTEGGEVMFNRGKEIAHIIPGQPNGDTNLTYTEPSDTIITNEFNLAAIARPAANIIDYVNSNKLKNRGMLGKSTDSFMKDQAVDVLSAIADTQKYLRDTGVLEQPEMLKAKNGKDSYPKFSKGWENRIITGLGVLQGLGTTLSAYLNRPKNPNTYSSNRFQNNALNRLASLRVNPYPIIQELYNQNRQNRYSINNTGGLTDAQRQYANIANNIGMYDSIAKAYSGIQNQNNAYISDWAKTAISAGQNDRVARMQTNQWDLDYYSKAHAARQQMAEMGWYNAMNSLQQGYANWYKKHVFDKTMSLYNKDYIA